MAVAVIDKNGTPLMPTSNYRARKLLKSGRAKVYKYRPVFTIQLLDREGGAVQPVEYKCDTGYAHIGISACSEKHEYVNAQYDLLPDETERHNDRRKFRRSRRNRLRYRKPGFQNRKGMIAKDGFAPSIRNKRDCHIRLFREYMKVLPVTKAVFEIGQFDTQVLKAVEEGRPLPQGTDYQHGEQYGYDTLREAVFARDGYKCICCGKSAFDGAILRLHHLGYLTGDRTNRMSNLGTVCMKCHTAKNHKPGGKLYNLKPKLKDFKGATFMTAVRWDMLRHLREEFPDTDISVTYGAATKRTRIDLGICKSHSNDAYCMGEYHPKHRTDFIHYKKRRRNNRILEKFYDAKYMDIRDDKKKSGSRLSCGRTNRSEPRLSDKNERIYRGEKVYKGRCSIRRQRYPLRPGDFITYQGERISVIGVQNLGKYVKLSNAKVVPMTKVTIYRHMGRWECVS